MSKKESGKRGGTDQDVKVKLPEYDPELDPESPEFNMDKWAEVTTEARQGLIETMERAWDIFSTVQPIYNEQSKQIVEELQDSLRFLADVAAPMVVGVGGDHAWQGSVESMQKIIGAMLDWINFSAIVFEESGLTPYLQAELKKPEYEGRSVEELWSEAKTAGKVRGSLFMQAVEAAEAAQAADEKKPPAIHYNNTNEIRTVTDKLANIFFALDAPTGSNQTNGQMSFTQLQTDGIKLRYERKKSKKDITLFYDYFYDEKALQSLGLSKGYEPFDFFVTSVSDNLFSEGNTTVSLTKFWHEMGGNGSPNTDQLTELANSLLKGMSTTMTIDDTQVQEAWGNKTGKTHRFTSQVMPIRLLEERFAANGKVASGQVQILGYSPFFTIAQQINHMGSWKKDVLRLYKGRRTKRYYSVLQFLISQIGWMRNANSERTNKILYSSLYSHTGDKTARGKELAKKMLFTLLDEVFMPTGYVLSYRESPKGENPGVILQVQKQEKIAGKKRGKVTTNQVTKQTFHGDVVNIQ